MTRGIGPAATRSLITKLVGDAIRKGKQPKLTASFLHDCMFNELNPVDADLFLRLRARR
jgi:hypothetical protein